MKQNIENAILAAEAERRKKLLNQRLELARSGLAAYQKGKITEAVRAFQSYLRILEEVKSAGESGLIPSCFDFQRELPELLMVSGVYWDLVKLYDRTKSPDKQREFHLYMDKYIIFSKGMPYQYLCAETLRKYIQQDKALHRAEFKNAYNVLKTSRCFVASALVDVIAPQTLPNLQHFRDQVLKNHTWGRRFTLLYYKHGPKAALWVNRLPRGIRKFLGFALDVIAFSTKNRSHTLGSKEKLAVGKAQPKG